MASPSLKSGYCHGPLPNEGMILSSVRIPCILRHKTGQPVTASVLKPEIRFAQAVSQFEADLSSKQKAVFHTQKSQFEKSPPDESDVMRLTAEINRASLVKG